MHQHKEKVEFISGLISTCYVSLTETQLLSFIGLPCLDKEAHSTALH